MLKRIIYLTNFLVIFTFTLSAQTINLKIVETSDVHGAIFPYDLKNDRTSNSSLAQVMTYLREERSKPDQHVILLDNGDILQGDPIVYYYNFEKTDAVHIYADVMNYMKYDAGTVGNHDIEPGHDVYDKFVKEINFPWLAANAVKTSDGKPYFKPYTMVEIGLLRIAVLGLITPSIPNWLPEKIWEGMEFHDMIESAKKWVKEIKLREQPDMIIGLFHAGVDYTYAGQNADSYKNENASKLVAEQVPGFDIIFVGHDHAGWNFTAKNPEGKFVLILGTLAGAQTVAVANLTLTFDKICELWSIDSIDGEIVNIKNYLPDEEFMERFSPALEEAKQYVNRKIGEFDKAVSSRDAIFGPSEFTDLVHNIQLELTDADISFSAPLALNTQIKAGDVFVRDMFNLYRYENLLYTMSLRGQEIKDYLEYSYANWFNMMKDENDNLLKFKIDGEGNIQYSERTKSPELAERFYNYESAAGINYVVDVTKPEGSKVTISNLSDGRTFDLNSTYKVAVNSYRGNGGGGLLTRGAGIPREELSARVLDSTEKDLRYYMMHWIEKQGTVSPSVINNWKVVPETWWQKGKAKDYKIMFGI
ncbi:MAG TPA: bifunctional UDP-sugar hydrolase/5'-nucleotidase [Ignavibacteriaceae bacterium]|nr:bifunctional UDP-sugar hydrolase/5'-nucleotidase [Ignavibacteriaceae bacterium]